MTRIKILVLLPFACAPAAWPQQVELAPVIAKTIYKTVALPGEFAPFLSVSLHARVSGYVDRVLVDRGSAVKQGDILVELSAPEMTARIAEAEAISVAPSQSDATMATLGRFRSATHPAIPEHDAESTLPV